MQNKKRRTQKVGEDIGEAMVKGERRGGTAGGGGGGEREREKERQRERERAREREGGRGREGDSSDTAEDHALREDGRRHATCLEDSGKFWTQQTQRAA